MNRPFSLAGLDRHAGWIAAASCLLATIAFAAALPGYSHSGHPIGLLGAREMPHALAYNLFGFILPGLLATWTFARLRERLPAGVGRTAPIGSWLLAIGALAFAAQGVWSLDPHDLDGAVSQWHATAWMVWWLAFAVGALLFGAGTYAAIAWRGMGIVFAIAGALTIGLNVLASAWVPGPLAQRAVLLVWLACVVLASRRRGGGAT